VRGIPAHRVAAAAVAAAIAAPDAARADDAAVLAASTDYFAGERAQGAAWGVVGAVSVTAGALGLASDDAHARGAAIPMLSFGAIQLGAAAFSYFSPPRRLRKARAAIARDGTGYLRVERARIERIVFWFDVLKVSELALIVGGTGLALGAARAGSDTWVGVGGGLAAQGMLMLALDASAHDRALRYLDKLSIGVVPGGAAASFSTAF
jgi:hypothetical protein